MRKNMHTRIRQTDEPENPFTSACHHLHVMANISMNWLHIATAQPLQMVQGGQGCMRSVRLARLHPGSHELTAKSALQIVVLPASFDFVQPMGFDHPRWQLLVYSWLEPDLTRSLMAHLREQTDVSDCRFFRVAADGCHLIDIPRCTH